MWKPTLKHSFNVQVALTTISLGSSTERTHVRYEAGVAQGVTHRELCIPPPLEA